MGIGGRPSSFYEKGKESYKQVETLIEEMDGRDDWRVPPWWRAAIHWQWLSADVSFPHPPDTCTASRADDAFDEYFRSIAEYETQLLFSAYLAYLEEVCALLKNGLEQTRFMQAQVIGALVTGVLFFVQVFMTWLKDRLKEEFEF